MSESRSLNFWIITATGAVATVQIGLYIGLYKKYRDLANRLSKIESESAQQIAALKFEFTILRQSQQSTPFLLGPRTSLPNTEADDYLSLSESEFLDALEEPAPAATMASTTMTSPQKQNRNKIKKMLVRSDQLYTDAEFQDCYNELKKVDNTEGEPEILWRLARVCHQMASPLEPKNPRKKSLLDEAHSYAMKAYKAKGDDLNILKWAAAVTGTRTYFLGTKEKIEQGKVFKELLDKALAINPGEYSLLHMRGQFSYSVAGLSWIERKLAATLFSAPPEATYDDAIKDFLAVEKLKPEWLENSLFLAKAYIGKGDKKSAVDHLKKAIALIDEDAEEEDSEVLKDAKEMLKKYGK